MSNDGSQHDPWADAGHSPTTPPPPPGASDPTMVQPTTPSASAAPDATTVQPVTAASAGGGIPPLTPPTAPNPGGTPPGPPPGGRPDRTGPIIAGLMVGGLVAAIVVVLILRGGDDDTLQSVDASPTTALVETTIPAVETTLDPALTETTIVASETTLDVATTLAPETTAAPTTVEAAPTTAPAPETTAAPTPTTEAPPAGPAAATPGAIRVDGVEYGIERSCFTVPLAPNNGDLQVSSHLIRLDNGQPMVVEQWFDEGGITGANVTIGGRASNSGELLELDQGYAIEAPAGSGDYSIVANPTDIGSDCASEQGIQTFDAAGAPMYLRALVDACFTSDDAGTSTVIGYGSELGRVEILGTPDGAYTMSYTEFSPRLDAAPAEIFGEASSVAYSAPLDGGAVTVYTEDALLRDCTAADLG